MVIARGIEKVLSLPIYLEGTVVKGFGRGSKQLGIPTANLPTENYENILNQIPTGIYFGWVSVNYGPVYSMAMSIGWNPFFKNEKKTIPPQEIHIVHDFEEDFYGAHIRAIACGYIRNEANFSSLDELIQAIQEDVSFTKQQLELPEFRQYTTDKWLIKNENQ